MAEWNLHPHFQLTDQVHTVTVSIAFISYSCDFKFTWEKFWGGYRTQDRARRLSCTKLFNYTSSTRNSTFWFTFRHWYNDISKWRTRLPKYFCPTLWWQCRGISISLGLGHDCHIEFRWRSFSSLRSWSAPLHQLILQQLIHLHQILNRNA